MKKKLSPITQEEVLLEEFLKPMGISQSQLAKDINVPANRISQVVHGKREITADTKLMFTLPVQRQVHSDTPLTDRTGR